MVACKGRTSGLSVIVGAYSSNVECMDIAPLDDDGECSKVLDRMQVTSFPYLFTRQAIPRRKSVIVPIGGLKFTGKQPSTPFPCQCGTG